MRRLAAPSSACYPHRMVIATPPHAAGTARPDGVTRAARLARLAGLYAVCGGPDPAARAEAALDGGARVVQLRWKEAPAGAVLAAARRTVDLARGRALVIVNDRADLALLSGADGVHLGDEDLPVAEARALLGPDRLIGRTCRTLGDARRAVAEGADHVGFGPMFPSGTKRIDVPMRTLEELREVAAGLGAPVVAISGITLGNVGAIAGAGAACAAVIGDLFEQGDVRARARALAAAFEAGRAGEGRR
jgi:thiamine-phosphate pyrophosphorylase